ncbi:MAG: hypothetical protein B6226_02085 [Candidatus Cloacimonetes bacterium 4572_65]|nr:MAG: hypothetical protein B6226_02085 [Candidatus Cloacimonetes bacterium 4572_65]
MINPKVEKFLENNNINYLFCLLANKEVSRLNELPQGAKASFSKTITEEALDHIATNNVPDYMFQSNENMLNDDEMEADDLDLTDSPFNDEDEDF